MKIFLPLFLALTIFIQSNAQINFDKTEFENISNLINNGKYDQAQQILNKIRSAIWTELTCEEKAMVYKNFGNLYYYLYEEDRALQYYKDSSYQKVIECGITGMKNDLLNNIGIIYQYNDKQLLASKYYKKLRLNYLSKKILPTEKSIQHLLNLASFYEDYGDLYNTFLCAWKAKQIAEPLNLKLDDVYNLLGIYFERTKQYNEAINNYAKAIDFLTLEGKPIPTTLLFNQALTYRFMKMYSSSLEILDFLKSQNTSEKEVYAILNLEAMIYADQGNYDKSERTFLQLDNLDVTTIEKKYHLENRADLKLKMGDNSGAIRIYKSLLAKLEKKWAHLDFIPTSSPDLLEQTDLMCLLSKALYLDSKKGNTTARREIINKYNFIRSNVAQIVKSNWESQSSSHLLDQIYPNLYYTIMSHVDEYNDIGDFKSAEQAYQILSEFKNQILERDIHSRMLLRENLADTVLAQYYKLKSDLNIQYLEDQDSIKSSRIQSIENFEKHQFKFDSILTQEGQLLSLKPKSIVEIQNTLNNHDAFLDIYFAKNKLIRFWITKNEIKINSTHLSTEAIYELLTQIKTGRSINKITNDSIFMALFEDFDFHKTKNITVHSDGLFHNVPFGAIKNPKSNSFLIEEVSFRYLLSTDSLYTENYKWVGEYCLGVASDYSLSPTQQIDSFATRFGKLTGTVDELSYLSNHYTTTSLINQNASFDNFANQLSEHRYNIVQLSLHGMLDDRFPALSGLIFEDVIGTELVDLNRLTGLNINTDLTIVNSCHSGDGKHITGEAIASLNTSLFISGSKANIVNLWSSSDIASSEILKNFHREISNGKTKSEALQLAKKKYLSTTSPSFKHPKYWSSLVLFGNDSPIHKNHFNSLYLLISAVLGLIIFFFIKKTK